MDFGLSDEQVLLQPSPLLDREALAQEVPDVVQPPPARKRLPVDERELRPARRRPEEHVRKPEVHVEHSAGRLAEQVLHRVYLRHHPVATLEDVRRNRVPSKFPEDRPAVLPELLVRPPEWPVQVRDPVERLQVVALPEPRVQTGDLPHGRRDQLVGHPPHLVADHGRREVFQHEHKAVVFGVEHVHRRRRYVDRHLWRQLPVEQVLLLVDAIVDAHLPVRLVRRRQLDHVVGPRRFPCPVECQLQLRDLSHEADALGEPFC